MTPVSRWRRRRCPRQHGFESGTGLGPDPSGADQHVRGALTVEAVFPLPEPELPAPLAKWKAQQEASGKVAPANGRRRSRRNEDDTQGQ
jgi:hypothetical protein